MFWGKNEAILYKGLLLAIYGVKLLYGQFLTKTGNSTKLENIMKLKKVGDTILLPTHYESPSENAVIDSVNKKEKIYAVHLCSDKEKLIFEINADGTMADNY